MKLLHKFQDINSRTMSGARTGVVSCCMLEKIYGREFFVDFGAGGIIALRMGGVGLENFEN